MAVCGPLRLGLRFLSLSRHATEHFALHVALGGFGIGEPTWGDRWGGGSLGGLVSKLGCNLHKSPGVVGSGGNSQPGEDGGRALGSIGGGSGAFTSVLARQPPFLTSPSVWGHSHSGSSPVQCRVSTGHWVKREGLADLWGFVHHWQVS